MKIFQGDGIFSPGGSLSNMYGMMLARHNAFPDIKVNPYFILCKNNQLNRFVGCDSSFLHNDAPLRGTTFFDLYTAQRYNDKTCNLTKKKQLNATTNISRSVPTSIDVLVEMCFNPLPSALVSVEPQL